MNNNTSTIEAIDNIIKKAKIAQLEFEKYNQEQVDEVVTAVAWSICNPTHNKLISDLAVNTTSLGKRRSQQSWTTEPVALSRS